MLVGGGWRAAWAALVVTAGVVGQDGQRLVPGETLTVTIPAGSSLRSLGCDAVFQGQRALVRIGAWSDGLDVVLRVEGPEGRLLAEDDDSGGGTDAFVEFELAEPTRLRVVVSAGTEAKEGRVEVRCALGVETEATLRAARAAADTLAEVGALVAADRIADARARLSEVDRALEDTPGGGRSPALFARRTELLDSAMRVGALAEARRAAEARHAECVRTLPPRHSGLWRCAGDLAQVLRAQGELRAAWELQDGVVETFERTLPPDHLHVQIARANLASLLVGLGDLRGALRLQQRVEADFARRYPRGHPHLWTARQNLAATLNELGEVRRARALQESVLAGWSELVPDDHPALQSARINLAHILTRLGDLEGARLLVEGVLAVRSRTLPPDHPRLQTARGNLAAILVELGELDGALALQEEVVQVLGDVLPPDHPQLLTARAGLAATLATRGDRDRAREILADVVRRRERAGHRDDPDLFVARLDLAEVLREDGELAAARELLERTLEDSSSPSIDRLRTRAQASLAELLAEAGDAVALADVLRSLAANVERRLLEFGTTLTPRRCAAAVASARREISTVVELAPRARGIDSLAFRVVEAARGLETAAHAFTRAVEGASGADRDRLRRLRTAVAVARHRVAEVAQSGAEPAELQRAVEVKERAEAALQETCRELTPVGDALAPVTPEGVAGNLRSGDVAVGYWRSRRAGQSVYVAWVVRPDAPLARVEIGPSDGIDDAIRTWRDAVLEDDAERARDAGCDLRRRLVDPVRAEASVARRWLVALDDTLHLVPLDALPEDGEQLFGDSVLVVQVPNLRAVPSPVVPSAGTRTLLTIGGVDYGAAVDPQRVAFQPLGAARREVRDVVARFESAFPDAGIERLSGRAVTKEGLAAAVRGARFVHVATHAWFAPDSIRSVHDREPVDGLLARSDESSLADVVRGLSPMVLCGVALSGANDGSEGILTAEELAGLDLESCDLAVLSGCETALGLRRSGQGLASIKQALHMAGARASLTSLWQVSDRATRALMAEFYDALWGRVLSPELALRSARRELRAARDAEGRPVYGARDWAGWVLTEAR